MFDYSKFKAAVSMVLLVVLVAAFFLGASVYLLRRQSDEEKALAANPDVTILRSATSQVDTVPLEEIIVGVVAGEMPMDFEEEALRAQSVAARTYILKRLPEPYGSGAAVHTGGANICDDFAHCQAYVDEEQRRKNWGDDFNAKESKLRKAVEATAGQILTYDGETISPTFCSTCGGSTEAAGDYWQSDVPALQAVPCYWDTAAPRYLSTAHYTKDEMAAKLGISVAQLPQLKIAETSATGRVTKVTCGDKVWKGSEIRTALGLNSTDFQWLAGKSGYLITVKGFGHGVGLCQHGANGMAKAGASYDEILHHYYTDVKIVNIADLQ